MNTKIRTTKIMNTKNKSVIKRILSIRKKKNREDKEQHVNITNDAHLLKRYGYQYTYDKTNSSCSLDSVESNEHNKISRIIEKSEDDDTVTKDIEISKLVDNYVIKNELLNDSTSDYDKVCNICLKKVNNNSIIIGCNHLYHIHCLAMSQINFNYLDDHTIEKECVVCHKILDHSEILYIHTKYFNNMKDMISEQDINIEKIEQEINFLKSEYKTMMDKRQKLEYAKEQSKKIMIYFTTMSNFT